MEPSAAPSAAHWLTNSLQRSVPDPSALPPLDPQASTDEAWREVSAALDWSPDQIAEAVAKRFRLSRADMASRDEQAQTLLPRAVAEKHGVVVLRHTDHSLVVATANPLDMAAEQEVGFLSGRTTEFEVATPAEIRDVLHEKHDKSTSALDDVMKDLSEGPDPDLVRVVAEEEAEQVSEREVRATPVVRLTNLILQKAVDLGATDIHMEPERTEGRVRFRIDGVLQPFMTLPVPALIRVVSRIKVLADLDIADRIRPQDGRMRIEVGGKALDLRISTVPVRQAEKIVIRILDPSATFDMSGLGLNESHQAQLDTLLSHRTGLVLVTGPTGSGKTTTLYAALTSLDSSELNISTVEHPVEYELEGISQIQVEPKKGVTFASALRALLRQDPDVILVGEIRDPETAEVAAHASMTGHQVLATLHTNDAVGVVHRLHELGLDPGVISSTLRGVVAQRLVRSLCPECSHDVKSEWDLPDAERERAAQTGVMPGRWADGCDHCQGSGLRGRTPLIEVLTVTREFARAIDDNAPTSTLVDILEAAGHQDLNAAGKEAVLRGLTTPEEIERVLGTAPGAEREDDHHHAPGAARGPAQTANEPAGQPISDPAPTAEPSAAEPWAAGARAPRAAPPAPGVNGTGGLPTVLVVDDDTGTRKLIGATLKAAGFGVEEAADGEEALNVLGKDDNGIGLVTLDLNMPRIGGMDVLETMRVLPSAQAIPVVVATSSGDEASELELLSAGADDYLVKPINPARLVTRLQAVLRRQAFRAGAC